MKQKDKYNKHFNKEVEQLKKLLLKKILELGLGILPEVSAKLAI